MWKCIVHRSAPWFALQYSVHWRSLLSSFLASTSVCVRCGQHAGGAEHKKSCLWKATS